LEHEDAGDGCVCGPHVEYFAGGRVIVHHALDGRNHGDPDWPRRRAHQVACEYLLS
jgi:hypothetical protein